MTAEGVRASRTGDRYHYFWASRRALKLLDIDADLEVISIEGARDGEAPPGEEIIDVGEYYGGSTIGDCLRMRCIQLKHSTVRVDVPITSSELENTLAKFAGIYRDAAENGQHTKLGFAVVTNRMLNANVRRSLGDLAERGAQPTHPTEAGLLRRYMGFGTDLSSELDFCSRLVVDDGGPDIDDVEHMLREELNQYIPGGGTGAETAELMEKVARLATSQSSTRTLDRSMVLLTLRVYEDDLFPARPKIETLERPIKTADVDVIVARLRSISSNKLLLTAVGGVGKSILTTLLRRDLDSVPDSLTIVFDCFAGGDYRRVTSKRHLHKIALTQIANEVASRGLCGPLIPSAVADDRDYVRTFMRKLHEAADQLRAKNPAALLTVIVDAADNAIIAADEFGERAFIPDLFREHWPANARLVALSRPERADSLELPPGIASLNLIGFRPQETLAHLRSRFAQATEEQATHLHQLSARNPRVQAMAMELAGTTDEAIAALEVATARPGEPLDALLAAQVDAILEEGQMPKGALRRLCQALATLHPAIPLVVLGEVAGLSVDAIRSFAVALGRGLHIDDENLQFRDEPTETWFRTNYRLGDRESRLFAQTATGVAERSPYMAKELPQVYFEAGMLDELMQLALSESSLPGHASDLQRKEISRSRVRYALAAALRSTRNTDAALLAVKAGEMSAGHARRMQMYRKNADLTAMFLAPAVVESLCSGRELATGWPGSSLHVEAALLSYLPSSSETARSRYHSAFNNMRAILQLRQRDQRRLNADIDADSVADLAVAALNLEGPSAATAFVENWRPSEFVREVSDRFFTRLGDAGRDTEISEAIVAARKKYFRLAAAEISFEYGIQISPEASAALVRTLLARHKPFKPHRKYLSDTDLRGVVWSLLHGLKYGQLDHDEALRILDVHLPRHLPDRAGESWYGLSVTSTLISYALRSRLTGAALSVDLMMSECLAETLAKPHLSGSGDARSFQSNIPGLVPWATLLVDLILDGATDDSSARLRELAADAFTKVPSYQTPFVLINGVAELATRALVIVQDAALIGRLTQWIQASGEALHRSRLVVIRNATRSRELATLAVATATVGFEFVQADRTDSENRVDELIALARAVLATSKAEARALFNAADDEAELVGDDLYARWFALTRTATSLAAAQHPERAYRLFQIGEAIDRVTEWGAHELAGPLHHLHPTAYYAAVSRARDRRTLDNNLLLKPIFTSATELEGFSRLSLLAMGPRADWREVVADLPGGIKATASEILTAFTIADRHTEDLPSDNTGASHWGLNGPDDRPDPSSEFVGADFTSEETWNLALGATHWYSDERRDLVTFACEQQRAHLADVLRALAHAVQAAESDLVTAARFAASGTTTLGVRQALADLARTYAARYARQICAQRYKREELTDIATAGQLSVKDLLSIAFLELGRSAHQLRYAEYFDVASNIAELLPEAGKEEAFDALAALFDDLAPPATSSDGAFSALAPPPPDQDTGLAGLLWAALGDISIRMRWQAAHAVLLLVQLGDTMVLRQLAKFADGTHATEAYRDLRFPVYELHSRMWLLLAIERASSEPNAKSLEPFTPWLEGIAHGPSHAVNQLLSVNSLRILGQNNEIQLSTPGTAALRRRLSPSTVELDWRERRSRPDPLADRADAIEPDRAYPFFFDFQKYWCGELADIFGSTEESVAKTCAQIAGGLTEDGGDATDPRRTAGVFGENSTYSSHGSWPEEEDHDFYSGIHALLTLGAELALTETAYQDADTAADSYTQWTYEFLTKRRDGRWLSDRRDTAPAPAPERKLANQKVAEDWPWSIRSEDFDDLAGIGEPWITVYASTYTGFRKLGENTHIESALVPHETARALIIAIQTSSLGPNFGHIPTSGEVHPFDEGAVSHPYTLTPWLDASGHHEAIDKEDERGCNVPYPPTRPTPSLVERFALIPDSDMRTWVTKDSKTEVFRNHIWDNAASRQNDYETGTRGQVVTVSEEFLKRVLEELDKSLVIQVGLRREVHRSSYERKKNDELDYIEWSAKTYFVSPNGRWTEY